MTQGLMGSVMKLPLQTYAWLTAMLLASAGVWPKSNQVNSAIGGVRRLSLDALEWFGGIAEFCARMVKAAVKPPYEGRELVRQMDEIGAKSLPLVVLAGAAIGVVLSLHTRDSFAQF
jgi:ABC-type transporter Mla maintaining outer membrane lipid asymmetry permease subunit MlaE